MVMARSLIVGHRVRFTYCICQCVWWYYGRGLCEPSSLALLVQLLNYAEMEGESPVAFVLVYMSSNEASNAWCCRLCMLHQHVVLCEHYCRNHVLCTRQLRVTDLCT